MKSTFAQWLARAGSPYWETRYHGQPHECTAVCVDGLTQALVVDLFDLSDLRVSARVSGNFVELETRKPVHA